VSAETRNGEAAVVNRVNKSEDQRDFVPLANPGRQPEPRKRGAYRRAQGAVETRDENFKGGVEAAATEAVEEVDSVES
jgi:hypothetical protein